MTATDAAAEAVAETVETVVENSGKILGFVIGLGIAAAATAWLVKRVGIAAQGAAEESGLLDPPAYYYPPAPDAGYDQGDPAADPDTDDAPAQWGDSRPAGAEFMGG